MSKGKIAGIASGVLVVAIIIFWVSTAPYLPNYGIYRMPGVFIGGTLTDPPADFSKYNGQLQGPIFMKQAGFPPMVVYISWVGEPGGVITATRPDGGYWAQRIRERGGDGWLRFGDETFAMTAEEITGPERLEMMAKWAAKSGRSLDEPLYDGSEPLRDWEVFFWRPQQ